MDSHILFINPIIWYCFNLPLHYNDDEYLDGPGYSFGFISRGLSDYLVVKIYLDENDVGESIPSCNAWVYTYVENDWKPLKIHGSFCPTSCSGEVYHGLLHWSAKKWVENAWYI